MKPINEFTNMSHKNDIVAKSLVEIRKLIDIVRNNYPNCPYADKLFHAEEDLYDIFVSLNNNKYKYWENE